LQSLLKLPKKRRVIKLQNMRNKAAVQLQVSQPLRRKNALQFPARPNLLLNGEQPVPKDDNSDISSSDAESEPEELTMRESQLAQNSQFQPHRKFALLKHVLVFVLRINKLLEYRKIYGVPKYCLNPHFKPLELIRRNLNYNSQGYGCGSKNIGSTLHLLVAKKKNPRWLFYPNQIGIQFWQFANIIVISFLLVYVPPSIAFSIESKILTVLNYVIDVFFIVDLLLNFNITFQHADGTYETSRWAIAKKYLLGNFVIDLLTSFPFSWIVDAGVNVPIQYHKALRALKLPKLMATLKLTNRFDLSTILMSLKLGDMWKYRIKSNEGFFKIMVMILLVFLAIHIGACIWIIIGTLDNFGSQTWIIRKSFSNLSDGELYLTAFYYCLVVFTTVGFGDIFSVNSLERSFTILWMMFGIAFYSFVISFITQHFTNIDTPKSLLDRKLKQLKAFSVSKQMPSRLFNAIRKNLRHAVTVISYRWVDHSKSFLTNLPLELKYNFCRELHREVLRSPFFDSNNDAFAVRILERLKPLKLRRNQFMWGKNDIPSNIVFVVEGKMFYMIDNVYYRSPEKRKHEERIKMQFLQVDSERRSLAVNDINENENSNIATPSPRKSYLKLTKFFKFFGQKDVQRAFGGENGADSEFKNYTQIQRHLLVDPSKTNDIRDLPMVSFRIFGPGSYLGEEEIIWPSPRKYYLKAATDVQLMVLPRTDFEKIVKEEFPQIYQKITDHAHVRSGWFDSIKKTVLKQISDTLRRSNARQFHYETKDIIEKSVYKIRKEREIYEIPDLDSIIDKAQDTNLFQNLLEIDPTDTFEENQFDRDKVFARERAKSPGLMKIYSTWRSKLIRA